MNAENNESIELKLKRIELLRAKKKMQDELPHLYGFKHYLWSRRFWDAKNKLVFLAAPNQIGKSAVGIRKCIDICTNEKWWGVVSNRPRPILGFYLYPDLNVARREIHTKWINEFLPRGEMKDHPVYGWKLIDKDKKLAIQFNSGVELIFLGYSQGKANILSMAASSPDFIFIDEEMPPVLWNEISVRVEAIDGTIHFLATPVECYPFWRDVFNGTTKLPGALVMTVTMYDCLRFEDGSPGMYTVEKIKARIAKLGTQAEIDKRVFGKYVTPEGALFPSFNRSVNYQPAIDTKGWFYYSGVDPGSGGQNGHPAAIAIVAVSPDFTKGRVVKFWKGNKTENTTVPDILEKYIEMTQGLTVVRHFYDWASADFGTLAQRAGIPFEKADKSRDLGIPLMNSLFKNEALIIDEHEDHLALVEEFESLRAIQNATLKRHAKDDGADATRYAVSKIPWNIVVIEKETSPSLPEAPKPLKARDEYLVIKSDITDEVDAEMNFWNEQFEG